jgi:hypothetical protein
LLGPRLGPADERRHLRIEGIDKSMLGRTRVAALRLGAGNDDLICIGRKHRRTEPIVPIRKYYIWDKALPATSASLQTVAIGN